VILLDTCALIYDALDPRRLGRRAARLIEEEAGSRGLLCSDISLWETAMLAARGRLTLPTSPAQFLTLALEARSVQVAPITPEIAELSCGDRFHHADPADRIIAATAIVLDAPVVTCDARLREVRGLKTVW
jgi:PIN domain nuclease of toxin-antitoxin system